MSKKLVKALLVVSLLAPLSALAQCYTQTYIVNGTTTTCLVCPRITTCN